MMVRRFLISITTLAALVACGQGDNAQYSEVGTITPELDVSGQSIGLNTCRTSTLVVELNTEDRSSKHDLLAVMTTLANYPEAQLRVHPAGAIGSPFVLSLQLRNHARWNEIQERLGSIPGVTISCSSVPITDTCTASAMQDELRQDDHKQREPKKGDGGVGVGN